VIPRIEALRYVTPLREGGSLPGLMEADDLGTYVVKFRGAGQGVKVLVAEVIVTELARRLGIRVPELAAIDIPAAIAKYEADEEVQDLLNASLGRNLAIDFLPGAFGFDASSTIDATVAAEILWLDAYVANVDRSWRNPNLLVWHGDVWAIDHGAALYFHHGWPGGVGSATRFAEQPYDASQHILARAGRGLQAVDERLSALVTTALLVDVVEQVPAEWLEPAPGAETTGEVRAAYVQFLTARLAGARRWLPRTDAA